MQNILVSRAALAAWGWYRSEIWRVETSKDKLNCPNISSRSRKEIPFSQQIHVKEIREMFTE